jgi:hypothetical protein
VLVNTPANKGYSRPWELLFTKKSRTISVSCTWRITGLGWLASAVEYNENHRVHGLPDDLPTYADAMMIGN